MFELSQTSSRMHRLDRERWQKKVGISAFYASRIVSNSQPTHTILIHTDEVKMLRPRYRLSRTRSNNSKRLSRSNVSRLAHIMLTCVVVAPIHPRPRVTGHHSRNRSQTLKAPFHCLSRNHHRHLRPCRPGKLQRIRYRWNPFRRANISCVATVPCVQERTRPFSNRECQKTQMTRACGRQNFPKARFLRNPGRRLIYRFLSSHRIMTP